MDNVGTRLRSELLLTLAQTANQSSTGLVASVHWSRRDRRYLSFGGVMQFFFSVLLALFLTGCATRPITIQQAANVPASRILASQWLSQGPYTGSLIIKRDGGFMGSACTIRVFIDAVPVADLAPSEKVEVFVPVGEHIVGVTSNGICGGGASEAAVVIALERQKILRIASGQSGDIYLQPSAF